jgi:DNA-binding response OmpR family regulator
LIVLDAEFEEALELCKEMKKALRTALTPIFLITGRLKKSFREEAVEAGVTDFLSSQLDLEELEERLTAAKRAEELREKTSGLSSAIPNPKKEAPQTYWKHKKLKKKTNGDS